MSKWCLKLLRSSLLNVDNCFVGLNLLMTLYNIYDTHSVAPYHVDGGRS